MAVYSGETGCDETGEHHEVLLTSAGIKNASIRDALVDLLGKPIAESSALCIPTAGYGHPRARLPGHGLAAAFFPLVFAAAFAPGAAALGFVCGLAGGSAALVAIVRDRERALTVVAAVAPLAMAAAFLLAQLFSGNP